MQALAQFHDVLPTILDALGLGNNTETLPGHSLMPLIRGEVTRLRDSIITGYHVGIDRCVRDETWSYIYRPAGEPDELYNLIEDPREQRTSSTSVQRKRGAWPRHSASSTRSRAGR